MTKGRTLSPEDRRDTACSLSANLHLRFFCANKPNKPVTSDNCFTVSNGSRGSLRIKAQIKAERGK